MSRRPTSKTTVRPPTAVEGTIEGTHSNPIVDGEIVTMEALAVRFGMRNARAARDRCRKHGVPYRRDGQISWVVVADFSRALLRMPTHSAARGPRAAAALAAVAAMKLKARR